VSPREQDVDDVLVQAQDGPDSLHVCHDE